MLGKVASSSSKLRRHDRLSGFKEQSAALSQSDESDSKLAIL